MKKEMIGLTLVSLALTGCYQAQKPSLSVKPEGPYARVRISYGDERSSIGVVSGSDCGATRVKSDTPMLVSPHMTTREALTLQKPAATSLGMPKANKTPKVYYEYYIPANEPAQIQVIYNAQSVNPDVVVVHNPVCARSAVFVPAAGKDYEIRPTGTCTAKVFELVPTAGKEAAVAAAVPVRVCSQP